MFESRGAQIDFVERPISFSVAGADYFGTGHVPPGHQGHILVDATWHLPSAEPSLPVQQECVL
jgi:hypothetical protein